MVSRVCCRCRPPGCCCAVSHCDPAAYLLAGSAACYIGAVIGIGFLYHFFAPSASCGLNIAWITLTLVFAAVYTAISVSPWRSPSAGLLTSGVVFVYSTYLVWAALTSEPYSSCAAVSSTKALQVNLQCTYGVMPPVHPPRMWSTHGRLPEVRASCYCHVHGWQQHCRLLH